MDEVTCTNLDKAIDHYTTQLGYRLDMIKPADAPREALLSRGSESLRLVAGLTSKVQSPKFPDATDVGHGKVDIGATSDSEWIVGRAGMEYRDLIPGRLGGKVISSHIRLTIGGEVPDYVHYHKIDFQMIYCKRGRIKVVYEDQGPPFWLETGDCVLQPPEIRHRVLECTAGAEVIEVGMPAEHETWVEHEIVLPMPEIKPDRVFHGQRFVRHIADRDADVFVHPNNCEIRDTGISAATGGLADVKVIRCKDSEFDPKVFSDNRQIIFCFILAGNIKSTLMDGSVEMVSAGRAFICDSEHIDGYECVGPSEVLLAAF